MCHIYTQSFYSKRIGDCLNDDAPQFAALTGRAGVDAGMQVRRMDLQADTATCKANGCPGHWPPVEVFSSRRWR